MTNVVQPLLSYVLACNRLKATVVGDDKLPPSNHYHGNARHVDQSSICLTFVHLNNGIAERCASKGLIVLLYQTFSFFDFRNSHL